MVFRYCSIAAFEPGELGSPLPEEDLPAHVLKRTAAAQHMAMPVSLAAPHASTPAAAAAAKQLATVPLEAGMATATTATGGAAAAQQQQQRKRVAPQPIQAPSVATVPGGIGAQVPGGAAPPAAGAAAGTPSAVSEAPQQQQSAVKRAAPEPALPRGEVPAADQAGLARHESEAKKPRRIVPERVVPAAPLAPHPSPLLEPSAPLPAMPPAAEPAAEVVGEGATPLPPAAPAAPAATQEEREAGPTPSGLRRITPTPIRAETPSSTASFASKAKQVRRQRPCCACSGYLHRSSHEPGELGVGGGGQTRRHLPAPPLTCSITRPALPRLHRLPTLRPRSRAKAATLRPSVASPPSLLPSAPTPLPLPSGQLTPAQPRLLPPAALSRSVMQSVQV
jgi:hypothetical protein